MRGMLAVQLAAVVVIGLAMALALGFTDRGAVLAGLVAGVVFVLGLWAVNRAIVERKWR